jgi:hypothetical protein
MAMTAALMTATISGAIPSSEAGSGASGFGGLMGLDVLATLAAASMRSSDLVARR